MRVIPVSSCELQQNQCTGILTLLNGVSEIAVYFILDKIWYRRHPHEFGTRDIHINLVQETPTYIWYRKHPHKFVTRDIHIKLVQETST